MSPRGQFLDFVNTKVSEGIADFKAKLEGINANDNCSFKEVSNAFYAAYGPCLDATAVAIPESSIYSGTFYSAANIIGQAFLSYGRSKKDIPSYDKAIAWFKSTPKFSTSLMNEKSDICVVDFVGLAEKEKLSLESTQQKLQNLQKADFSEFFK
jgi:hypothetical protein